MKQGLTISQLAAQIEANEAAKSDFVTTTENMRLGHDGYLMVADAKNRDSLPATYGVNNHAHGQIADRLGIPSKYYERMRSAAPDLLATNVNRWFTQQPERRMVRTLNGTARAFLSDRYQRIDNNEIAKVVFPIFARIKGLRMVSTQITETRMYLKAITSEIRGEVKVGDIVEAGIMVTNSEVGAGAVNIQPFCNRLVCTNGMVIPDSKYRAHHVGARITGDEMHMLSNEAIKADDHAILLKVRDVTHSVLSQETFNVYVERMRASTENRLQANPAKGIEVLAKKVGGLTGDEQSGILRHLIEGGDLSQWGLANAVTRFAHDPEDYDRATELETIGGQVMSLGAADWKQIATAE